MELLGLTKEQEYKLKSVANTDNLAILNLLTKILESMAREIKPMVNDVIGMYREANKSEIEKWKKSQKEEAIKKYNGVLVKREQIDILINKVYIMSKICKYKRAEDIRLYLKTLALQKFFNNLGLSNLDDIIEFIMLVYAKLGPDVCAELIIKLKDARLEYDDNLTTERVGNILSVNKSRTTFGYEKTLNDSVLLDLRSICIVIFKRMPQEHKRILLWQELMFILMLPIDKKVDYDELRTLSKDYFRFLIEDDELDEKRIKKLISITYLLEGNRLGIESKNKK